MKVKILSFIALSCLSVVVAAQANEVVFKVNKPMNITYRIAHKNQNKPVVLSEVQSMDLDKEMTVPVALDNYDRAGVVIVSVNGHALPSTATQFDQPRQCSMTTDKRNTTGQLAFTLKKHSISCRTKGGVFG